MASYQKEREFFLIKFGQEFPKASTDVAVRMLREASAEQRYNEIVCSIEISESETRRLEKRSESRAKRMEALCGEIGAKLVENGDPRGFPFLLSLPSGKTYDWGERGLGIPGRGLPASTFT